VAVVSPEDGRELLGGRRGRPSAGARPHVLVTPNGVDTGRFDPSPLPDRQEILLTGTLDFLPNVDAACWFGREVLPLVRRQVPGAALAIVGRRPVADVVALSSIEGVSVHADVPTVEPYLRAARVAVVPVRIGTGSRVKALEAMAAGRPVAATSIGLEGIDVVAGRDALVGDTPEALAGAVVRLISEPDLAGRVAAAGRRLVVSRYRWSEIADAFASGLLRACQANSA
jgi:glycosyltransferase involved in cell wall biosynthesis